jgi:hypothetical protein
VLGRNRGEGSRKGYMSKQRIAGEEKQRSIVPVLGRNSGERGLGKDI